MIGNLTLTVQVDKDVKNMIAKLILQIISMIMLVIISLAWLFGYPVNPGLSTFLFVFWLFVLVIAGLDRPDNKKPPSGD